MSTDVAIAPTTVSPSPGPYRSRRLPSRVGAVAFALALIPLVWHVWATLHGYFTQDDFVLTYRAAHTPLSLHYLFQGYGGPHLMPGQFLLVWAVTRIAPGNYTVAVLPLLVMQGLASWVLWRVLTRLFPGQWGRVVPFGVFTLSPVIFITSMWWAFGLEIIPFALALFLAVDQHVRYLQTGLRRHARLALLATAGGLLFWEKAALVLPVLFAVTALLAPVDGVRARLRWAVRKRSVWLAYVVVVVAYGALYLLLTSPAKGDALNASGVAHLAEHMITATFIPRIMGGPWNGGLSAPPAAAVIVLTSIVAGAVVVGGLLYGRSRAAVAWLALAGYLACDVVLLAVARLRFIGPVIGNDPRYIADAVPVAVLLGALVFMRPSTASPGAPPVVASRRTTRSRSVWLTGAVVLAVGAMVSTALAVPAAQNRGARRYASAAAADVRAHPSQVLFDGGVPNDVLLPAFADDWRVSRVIALDRPRTRFDVPTEALFMVGSDGRTQPFAFFFPTPAVPGPIDRCGHLAVTGGTDIPLTRQVDERHIVAELDYFTGESSSGSVRAGASLIKVQFEKGVHSLFVVTDGPIRALRVSAGFPVCIAQALVGGPAPIKKVTS